MYYVMGCFHDCPCGYPENTIPTTLKICVDRSITLPMRGVILRTVYLDNDANAACSLQRKIRFMVSYARVDYRREARGHHPGEQLEFRRAGTTKCRHVLTVLSELSQNTFLLLAEIEVRYNE